MENQQETQVVEQAPKTPRKAKAKNPEPEVKRGRGRPATFPNTEVALLATKLPTETLDHLRMIAEKREVPIGVLINKMIERAWAEQNRQNKGWQIGAANPRSLFFIIIFLQNYDPP